MCHCQMVKTKEREIPMKQKRIHPLLLSVLLALLTLCLPIYAREISVPGGEVTDAASLLAALGGDDAAWINGAGELCLRADLLAEAPIIIKDGNYTINGAGSRLGRTDSTRPLLILESGATLSLGQDNNRDQAETILLEGGDPGSAPVIELTGGTLNIYAGALLTGGRSDADGGMLALRDGKLRMEGGVIEYCAANRGGALAIFGGEAELAGGRIRMCEAQSDGGGVYLEAGKLTLSGLYVGAEPVVDAISSDVTVDETQGCTANRGGGLFLAGGDCVVYAGGAASCTAENGGGVWIEPGASMYMVGGAIYANSATRNGGGLMVGGQLAIGAGELSTNRAENGGGLYILSGGTAVMQNGNLVSNEVTGLGGGVYNEGCFQIADGNLNYNRSQTGGGIYNLGWCAISGGSVGYNKTVYAFGACTLNLGTLELSYDCYVGGDNDIAVVRTASGEEHPAILDGKFETTTTVARLLPVVQNDDGGFSADYSKGRQLMVVKEGNEIPLSDYPHLFKVPDDATGGAWVVSKAGQLATAPLSWTFWLSAGILLAVAAAFLFFTLRKRK